MIQEQLKLKDLHPLFIHNKKIGKNTILEDIYNFLIYNRKMGQTTILKNLERDKYIVVMNEKEKNDTEISISNIKINKYKGLEKKPTFIDNQVILEILKYSIELEDILASYDDKIYNMKMLKLYEESTNKVLINIIKMNKNTLKFYKIITGLLLIVLTGTIYLAFI